MQVPSSECVEIFMTLRGDCHTQYSQEFTSKDKNRESHLKESALKCLSAAFQEHKTDWKQNSVVILSNYIPRETEGRLTTDLIIKDS